MGRWTVSKVLVYLVSLPLLIPAWFVARALDLVVSRPKPAALVVLATAAVGVGMALGWVPAPDLPVDVSSLLWAGTT